MKSGYFFLCSDRFGEKSLSLFRLKRFGFGGGDRVLCSFASVSNFGLRCLLIVIVTLNKLEVFECVERFELKLRSDLRDDGVEREFNSLSLLY